MIIEIRCIMQYMKVCRHEINCLVILTCVPPTGVDDGYDIEREMLEGMYQRIKSQEFRPGHDHVTQVLKVSRTECVA